MIQRAHLRLLFRWGFFCSFVAPWSSALSLSSTAISSALKARVAGSRSGALRACTSCMVVTAALAAMAVSLMSRSAVSTWLSSTRRPWSLSSRQNCSMVQRILYQSTICQAAAASLTSWVVSSRQCTASVPVGASRSTTSTRVNGTDCGRLRSRVAFLLALRQRDEPFRGEGEALRRGVEVLAGGEAAVVHDPADQVKTGLRRRRPLGEDVALPIGHHRHLGGRRQHALALFGGGDPGMGFLVFGPALLVGDLDPTAARPDASCDEAEAAAGAGIERQHGVQQHAAAAALADLAEPAPALRRGAEIEFAGVVDGQDVPPRGHSRPRRYWPLYAGDLLPPKSL